MEHCIKGAVTVAVAAVLLLSSCGGQQPGSGGSDSESWGTAPQQPPRTTTAQPSAASSPSGPQPSETFTPEQFEAANVLIEYYRIRDAVLSDLNADPQSLMDITIGQSQEIRIVFPSFAGRVRCRPAQRLFTSRVLRSRLSLMVCAPWMSRCAQMSGRSM